MGRGSIFFLVYLCVCFSIFQSVQRFKCLFILLFQNKPSHTLSVQNNYHQMVILIYRNDNEDVNLVCTLVLSYIVREPCVITFSKLVSVDEILL